MQLIWIHYACIIFFRTMRRVNTTNSTKSKPLLKIQSFKKF